MGQDPVGGPDQAEDAGRITIDKDAARDADAEGKGFNADTARPDGSTP